MIIVLIFCIILGDNNIILQIDIIRGSSGQHMGKDNRKHSRYRLFAVAIIEAKGKKAETQVTAHIENLSESGMGVYVSKPVDNGTPVKIEIKFTNVMGKKMKDTITGKVAWHQEQGELHYLGLEFDEKLTSDNYPLLYDYFCKENL